MKQVLFVVALIVVSLGTISAQTVDLCEGGSETIITRAYPNGSAELCWTFDPAQEPLIDGFWIFRSAKKGSNLDGTLGPFSKVATINKTQRKFVLSGPIGTYTYFLMSYTGSRHSTGSDQVTVSYLP